MDAQKHRVFITGGTGYVGRPLIIRLLERGHEVRALVRPGSEAKLPLGCQAVPGDALDSGSYAGQINPADTFVQLVGVAHPNPSKAAEFRSVDLASGRGAVEAARGAGVQHFVYVSVAQPAPVMKAYIQARAECEAMIRQSRMNATILRPWYVLAPLAVPAVAYVQDYGMVAGDPTGRDPPGTGYLGTDVPGAGPRRRDSRQGGAHIRGWANPDGSGRRLINREPRRER